MASSSDTSGDAREQLRELREQVDQLMRERVTPTLNEVAGRAQGAARHAQEAVSEQAEAVSGRVREAPLTAIVIAAAVGYLLGRVTR
jgi:ElaB/YqjD/DUF883 family membrane-anchored ribosome-binding protein